MPHYEAKGFRVLTPAYPGFEVEVEALRENPDIIAKADRAGPSTTSPRSSAPSTRRRSSWATPSVAR